MIIICLILFHRYSFLTQIWGELLSLRKDEEEKLVSEICPIVITFIATKNKIDQYKIAVLLLY